jgi:hypothetical protein
MRSHPVSENECFVHADAAGVFAILADGWSYAAWVVGASRVRAVDPGWPEPGRSIHHSVGTWPLLIDDTTTALEYEPLSRLRLKVRVWPAGAGEVEFQVTESSEGCRIVMLEQATGGVAALVPSPLTDVILRARNAETLRRLALLAEKPD